MLPEKKDGLNECVRCGYKWLPRIERRPKACPQCLSRRWDKEKVQR